jgi:hypothetical protein
MRIVKMLAMPSSANIANRDVAPDLLFYICSATEVFVPLAKGRHDLCRGLISPLKTPCALKLLKGTKEPDHGWHCN